MTLRVTGGVRRGLRKGELEENSVNELLRGLYLRLEALEKVQFVEWVFTTDGDGLTSSFVLKPPAWPVKSITIARLFEPTRLYYSSAPQLVWEYTPKGIVVAFFQSLGNSVQYTMTMEVRG